MLFFELLQIALGNRERLSVVPLAEEWTEMYAESERQAVTGILLHGIEKLSAEQRPAKVFLLQWIGVGEIIKQQNSLLNDRCKELTSNLSAAGLHPTILKGQRMLNALEPGTMLFDTKNRPCHLMEEELYNLVIRFISGHE